MIFDHIFTKLGVTGGAVDHPIVFTETLANPNASRRSTQPARLRRACEADGRA